MYLVDAIKDGLNKGYFKKAMPITELPKEYPAWTVKEMDWYGVFVKTNERYDFSESFSSVRIHTMNEVEVAGEKMNILVLSCSDQDLRNEFAIICSHFVDPGDNGMDRNILITNPEKWWAKWKSLIGNKMGNPEVYPLMGELVVYEELLKCGINPTWREKGSHDFELPNKSFEVKSTISRYSSSVEIHSVYQLNGSGKPLDLVFCRFEESDHGRDLNDVINSLISLGVDESNLESLMTRMDLDKGCTARRIKYSLINMSIYAVDEKFPAITLDSFTTGQLPSGVSRITYTVDLTGLESRTNII